MFFGLCHAPAAANWHLLLLVNLLPRSLCSLQSFSLHISFKTDFCKVIIYILQLTQHYCRTAASGECDKRAVPAAGMAGPTLMFPWLSLGNSWTLRWLRGRGGRDTGGWFGVVFWSWNSCLQSISFWTPEGDAVLLNRNSICYLGWVKLHLKGGLFRVNIKLYV